MPHHLVDRIVIASPFTKESVHVSVTRNDGPAWRISSMAENTPVLEATCQTVQLHQQSTRVSVPSMNHSEKGLYLDKAASVYKF